MQSALFPGENFVVFSIIVCACGAHAICFPSKDENFRLSHKGIGRPTIEAGTVQEATLRVLATVGWTWTWPSYTHVVMSTDIVGCKKSGQRLLAPEAVHKSLVLPKNGKDQKELLHLLAKIAKRIQVARTYAENWISQCGGLVGG